MPTSNLERRCAPYLEPQERFDRILAVAFRKFGPRLVDLSYANPYDGPDPRVVQAIRRALDDDRDLSFQYTPYGGATTTRRLIAAQLAERFDLGTVFHDVILTPGAMAGLNVVFRALCDTDHELLVLTPCWLDYPLYLSQLGIDFRFVPLAEDKHLDLDAIAAAIGPRTAGVVLTHPGCPTGVVLDRAELAGLAELLAGAEQRFGSTIYVISDEVHRDLVWGDADYASALCFHPRTVSLYSFGKALALQGQRIGYVAVSPRAPEREELRERLLRHLRMMGFCTPTNLMQRAVVELLDYEPPLARIAGRQRAVRETLERHGYDVCDASATFFVYARCPGGDDFGFTEKLADRGLLVLPSSVFHEPGFFRICVTAREESLRSGLEIFGEVV